MISLQEIQSIDPNTIAKPNYEHLKGVKVLGNILIDLDKIYYDEEGNNIRQEGQEPAHIENLKMSFAQGVDPFEFPFGVTKRKGNPDKFTHDLVYGFGRFAAVVDLGVKKYPGTLLECENESALDDVKVFENEILPKSENKEIDIKSAISKKINKGWIKNDEDTIRNEIKRICPYRKKQSVDRIVQSVISDCKTPQKYQFYSTVKAQQWLNNHSSEEYVIGEFDKNRDMFGYLVKEGYQYRFVMNAIRNYAKYGKKSYCIVHVGSPSGKSTIQVKRKQFIEELDEITRNFLIVSNNGLIVWEIMGFLPQNYGIENWKLLIK
jgi:hypothetical protein